MRDSRNITLTTHLFRRFAVQYASKVDAYAVDTAEEPKTMVRPLLLARPRTRHFGRRRTILIMRMTGIFQDLRRPGRAALQGRRARQEG